MTLTRRTFVAGTAAMVAAACTRPPAKRAPVTIARTSSYSAELYDLVRRILVEHRVDARNKRVVLKPNLVEFEDNSVINTNPALVYAAQQAFLSLGAAHVRVAEGPGHRRLTLDLADAAGFFSTIPKFESVFTDLNLDDVTKVNLVRPQSKLNSLYLPQTVLGCDLLVSMPKMKTHHWAGATLSMKNLFGLVPGGVYGWPKNILHWAGIDECIADLHQLFPRAFTIVDGIVGMEGNGPIQGTPKNLGVVVAGADPVAVDATCCRLMRIDPQRVRYLQLAGGEKSLSQTSIPQIGEGIASVASPFALLPQLESLRLRNNAG